jgi:hypothetical protein
MGRTELVFGIMFLVLGMLYILLSIYGEYDRDHPNAIKNLFRKETSAIQTPKWWRYNNFLLSLAILSFSAGDFWRYYHGGHLNKWAGNLPPLFFMAAILFSGRGYYYQQRWNWKKYLLVSSIAIVSGLGLAVVTIYLIMKHVPVSTSSIAIIPVVFTVFYFLVKHVIEKYAD